MGMFNITLLASDNSANTTVFSFNSLFVQTIALPTASEIVAFPTAAAAITYIQHDQNETRTRRYLTASTVAAVNALILASGSTGAVGTSGQTTLVAGTKAITIAGLTTSSIALVTLVSSLTGTDTVTYQAVCTANTLTLRANVAAGTINVADVSILNYAIVG